MEEKNNIQDIKVPNSDSKEVQNNTINTNNTDSKELQEINTSIKNLQKFFEDEKKERQIQDNEIKKANEKKEKQIKEEQKKLHDKQEIKEKELKEFYSDIKTISENVKSETMSKTLNDVSTLMQVNIVTNGLLIGIVCILLFSKFFGSK
ncbi:hypothetical protein PN398_14830 [Romboutsia sp. 1001216sp1]|uniref:hypothetical protein n=1 Tax=Romboutsia sp. 1001216sp1 TaxID=2986997 RepID=UPI0023301FB4|nr:hypothetical protein [Romboutsia sp. 1001216sp1]MDB8791995.1 hypothetical protein [Romboutsia sp. 1001216sp1]